MTSDQLELRFVEVLTRIAGDTATPDFTAMWAAFTEMAAIEVDDVYRPGTVDDLLEFSVGPQLKGPGTTLALERRIQKDPGAVVFYVVMEYEPRLLEKDRWASGIGGSEESVRAWVGAVQALDVFAKLAAPLRPLSIRQAQEEEE